MEKFLEPLRDYLKDPSVACQRSSQTLKPEGIEMKKAEIVATLEDIQSAWEQWQEGGDPSEVVALSEHITQQLAGLIRELS